MIGYFFQDNSLTKVELRRISVVRYALGRPKDKETPEQLNYLKPHFNAKDVSQYTEIDISNLVKLLDPISNALLMSTLTLTQSLQR